MKKKEEEKYDEKKFNEFACEDVILCSICRTEMKFHMRTHNHFVYKCDKCGHIHYE